jgi:hypothetical protein
MKPKHRVRKDGIREAAKPQLEKPAKAPARGSPATPPPGRAGERPGVAVESWLGLLGSGESGRPPLDYRVAGLFGMAGALAVSVVDLLRFFCSTLTEYSIVLRNEVLPRITDRGNQVAFVELLHLAAQMGEWLVEHPDEMPKGYWRPDLPGLPAWMRWNTRYALDDMAMTIHANAEAFATYVRESEQADEAINLADLIVAAENVFVELDGVCGRESLEKWTALANEVRYQALMKGAAEAA